MKIQVIGGLYNKNTIDLMKIFPVCSPLVTVTELKNGIHDR